MDSTLRFLKKEDMRYRRKMETLEKARKDCREILSDEPDREDVKRELSDIESALSRCEEILEYIKELSEEK